MPLNTFIKINQHQLVDLINYKNKIYGIGLIKERDKEKYIIPFFYNKPGVSDENLFNVSIFWDSFSNDGKGEWEFSMDKYPLKMRSAYIENPTFSAFLDMCIEVHEKILEKNKLRDVHQEMYVVKPGKLYRFKNKYWDADGNLLPMHP